MSECFPDSRPPPFLRQFAYFCHPFALNCVAVRVFLGPQVGLEQLEAALVWTVGSKSGSAVVAHPLLRKQDGAPAAERMRSKTAGWWPLVAGLPAELLSPKKFTFVKHIIPKRLVNPLAPSDLFADQNKDPKMLYISLDKYQPLNVHFKKLFVH